MALPFALRAVTYLLVSTGIAALVLGGLLGPLGASLVAIAVAASWWLERARERRQIRPALVSALLVVAVLAAALDLLYLAESVLDGMVHVLLVLILLRLFMCRSLADLRDVGFLSFFLLVATSTVTFGVGFLAAFVIFLVLGTWMLLLHHVHAEAERAGSAAAGAITVPTVLRVGGAAVLATLAIAGALFFVIPRVGQAMLPFRSHLTRMVTGFSDRVDLGSFGDIEADRTVVMRVYLPGEAGDPSRLPNLRWRGIVFDHFDGRTWIASGPARVAERRSESGRFYLAPSRGRGPVVRQEIYLDPIGTDVVFAAPRPVAMELRAASLLLDDAGAVSVPSAAARLQYAVESELEPPVPAGTRVGSAGATLSHEERDRYLQLPVLGPAVPRLARELTAGSQDPYEAAGRLVSYLSSPAFRYTLAKRETAGAPLEAFLLGHRSGNCEYFAAALAVMLRTLDVPARVVGGFQRGEWNPYGRYFMVQLADAHSWVEAHFDGLGWVTLDPSPRGLVAPAGEPWALGLYLDAVRMRWYRYVINWSLRDQRVLAVSLGRQARDLRELLAWPREWPVTGWWLLPGLAVLGLGLGWALGRGPVIRRRPGAPRPAPVPRFYARALRALARRGLRPEPWETARRFSARAAVALPGTAAPIDRLTRHYERARFGGGLGPAEADEAERLVAQIEAH
jgi:transglutaminase-like putative cysteine protease